MKNLNEKMIVTESPHMRSNTSTSAIMLDAIIALMPALIAGTVIFGYRAAVLAAVCVAASVFFEWCWCKIIKKPSSIGDFSAAVTGLLLALNLPVTMPLWMAVTGALFAIVIAKQFFGGIGQNFINPALAARAFLLTSWAEQMTKWVAPFGRVSLFSNIDAVSQATPLALLKSGETSNLPLYLNMFLGNTGGCIGETCAAAILIGAAYLIIKRVISIKIPAIYILTVAAFTFVFGGKDGFFTGDALAHVLSGGLLLGAFFMATDYTTTPCTPKGQVVFALGCGLLTSIIRIWGGYPEGVSYSILLMNVATPLIEKYTMPKQFGKLKLKGDNKNA